MQVTDQRLETAIGRTLQAGVLLAAAVVLTGGVMYLLHARGAHPDFRHFHGVAESLKTPSGIFRGVRAGDAASVIQFGLLLLIATPIARVVLAAVGFLAEHDRMYFWVSLAVLAVLIFSLLHAGI
jgi:uncharacterized membrane protein